MHLTSSLSYSHTHSPLPFLHIISWSGPWYQTIIPVLHIVLNQLWMVRTVTKLSLFVPFLITPSTLLLWLTLSVMQVNADSTDIPYLSWNGSLLRHHFNCHPLHLSNYWRRTLNYGSWTSKQSILQYEYLYLPFVPWGPVRINSFMECFGLTGTHLFRSRSST